MLAPMALHHSHNKKAHVSRYRFSPSGAISVLAIRKVVIKPNFLAVCIHGSLLASFGVVMINTCPCEVLFNLAFSFLIP